MAMQSREGVHAAILVKDNFRMNMVRAVVRPFVAVAAHFCLVPHKRLAQNGRAGFVRVFEQVKHAG